ncbi:MAG: hypothetical protein COB36_11735 [Alphaproteobacteria bacterium]|nr:MAG: hypothetical protein COB36_11735 [Alphaproteobacteria bacterium]
MKFKNFKKTSMLILAGTLNFAMAGQSALAADTSTAKYSCGSGYLSSFTFDRTSSAVTIWVVLDNSIEDPTSGQTFYETDAGSSAIKIVNDSSSWVLQSMISELQAAYLSGSVTKILSSSTSCDTTYKHYRITTCSASSDANCGGS